MEIIKNLDFNYDNLCKLSFYGRFNGLLIECFDSSKVSNPCIVCNNPIEVVQDKKNNGYNILNIGDRKEISNIKIYLSNDGKYNIDNDPGFLGYINYTKINNAKNIQNLDIKSSEIKIQDCKIENFNNNIKYVLDDVIIENSNIKNLKYPLATDLNIKDSNISIIKGFDLEEPIYTIIEKSKIDVIDVEYFKGDINASSIKQIKFKSGKVFLRSSEVGKITSEIGDLYLIDCILNDKIYTKKGYIHYQRFKYFIKKNIGNSANILDRDTGKKIVKAKAKGFLPTFI